MNRNLIAAWPARTLGLALSALTLGAAFAGAQTSGRYEASDAGESAEAEEEAPEVQAPIPTPRPTRAAPRVFRVVRPGVIHAEPNVESDDVQRSGEQSYNAYVSRYAKNPQSSDLEWQKAYAFNMAFSMLNGVPLNSKWDAKGQKDYIMDLLKKKPLHYKMPNAAQIALATDVLSGKSTAAPASRPPHGAGATQADDNRLIPNPAKYPSYNAYVSRYAKNPQSSDLEWQKAYAFNMAFSMLNGVPLNSKWDAKGQKDYIMDLLKKKPLHYKMPNSADLATVTGILKKGAPASLSGDQKSGQPRTSSKPGSSGGALSP